MQMVKAVTNRHPKFLKEAYKLDGVVDLVNDERWISHGDRFIRFDGLSFVVCIKADNPINVRKFDNLRSAVNCANRV
jgi:hypothetical protein